MKVLLRDGVVWSDAGLEVHDTIGVMSAILKTEFSLHCPPLYNRDAN